jgi:HlyD family secretion protein
MTAADPRRDRLLSVKPALLAGSALVLAVLAYLAWEALPPAPAEVEYRTTRVERGRIASTVTATGTVTAVQSVQVVAPVAGRITALLADFNAEVKRGQPLARIDPELFELRVEQAHADVEAASGALAVARKGVDAQHAQIARSRVALVEAQRDAERKRGLAERGFIVLAEAERAEAGHRDLVAEIRTAEAHAALLEAQVENARATLRQREASLAQARAALDRTFVRAPVNGVVIARQAEAGQMAAPGPDAPPLFVIARDLREMQVEAAVGESEIGRLRPNQPATFTVDAFPRRTFEGRVVQIRKAPQQAQGAVAYTAVIAAPNADLALLPGMSARVRVAIESRDDVLKIPNAALGFRADEAALGLTGRARVWRLDEATRRPTEVDVELGLSDGAYTEIVSGGLVEGETLVLGTATTLPKAAARNR